MKIGHGEIMSSYDYHLSGRQLRVSVRKRDLGVDVVPGLSREDKIIVKEVIYTPVKVRVAKNPFFKTQHSGFNEKKCVLS